MSIVVLVLIQVVIVIILSRIMGIGCRLIKQPLVIGEILAGIMLGPSLLGLISPALLNNLFPETTLPYLNILSQIGLIFFMFLIGLELNPHYLKGKLDVAILTSHVSILVPFCLGAFLALILYPLVSNNTVSFTAFALFLGAALSITAFPVLARIITENNLQKTKLGTVALTCAAVDDVTAWCLLAVTITIIRTENIAGSIPTIVESIVYIVFMLTVARWLLEKLEKHYKRTQKLSQLNLALIYIGVVISALITELIGIHLIFGAFLMGAAMPKHPLLVREIAEKTEDFVLIFLLPIFFAYSGLKTQIGLLNSPHLWLLCGLIILVAILGKYVGTYFAARFCKFNQREASALGWLMNTRGLTELIVLNIGLSLGVISPLLFTMLVIMALVTTIMTAPLLEWTYPKALISLDIIDDITPEITEQNPEPSYRILVPIANPKTQECLLKLAVNLAGNPSARIYPLNLIEIEDDYQFQNTPQEANRLIREKKQSLNKLIKSLDNDSIKSEIYPIILSSNDVTKETIAIAKAEKIDLILLGWHRPAFSDNRLGGRVGKILNASSTDVAIFVDKGCAIKPQNLLVAYGDNNHDDLGLSLALRMMINDPNINLKIMRLPSAKLEENHEEISYELRNMLAMLPSEVHVRIKLEKLDSPEPISVIISASKEVDLTIAGTNRAWGIGKKTLGVYTDQLAQECQSSLLITRRYSPVMAHLNSLLDDSVKKL